MRYASPWRGEARPARGRTLCPGEDRSGDRGQPAQRVVWRGDGRLHLAVRGVTQERNAGLARAVEAELARHPAVRWAVVNAPLGTVVVGCPGDAEPAELIAI